VVGVGIKAILIMLFIARALVCQAPPDVRGGVRCTYGQYPVIIERNDSLLISPEQWEIMIPGD